MMPMKDQVILNVARLAAFIDKALRVLLSCFSILTLHGQKGFIGKAFKGEDVVFYFESLITQTMEVF